jgi:hypothetical protein
LGYQHDGSGQADVCDVFESKGASEGIICQLWVNCPLTTKRHVYQPLWVNRKCGHGNVEPFNGRKICFDVSNGRGSNLHPIYEQYKVS